MMRAVNDLSGLFWFKNSDYQMTIPLEAIYVEVLKECICLVNFITQLHMYKLWLPQERQDSIKSLAFILIMLRNTAGNHQQCTRNLLSLRPQTDDKVISRANSLGQYFFPKHRYG